MKINNHLVSLTEWRYWDEYEVYRWPGGAITYWEYNGYADVPSKDECDRICAEMSGELVVYKNKKW